MLMGTHNGRIDKEVQGLMAILRLEAFPELPPDTACFPAAKAVVDRVPGPKIGWQVAPGHPCTGEIEDSFDEHAIAQRRGTPSTGFDGHEDGRNRCPCRVREQQTYRHPVSSIINSMEETYAQIMNSSTRPRIVWWAIRRKYAIKPDGIWQSAFAPDWRLDE